MERGPLALSSGPAKAMYPDTHLLSLPLELRRHIWWLIHCDTMLQPESPSKWYARRKDEWNQLQLTCRQIHDEVRDFWPRAVITEAQTLFKLTPHGLTISALKMFKHITLELPRHDWDLSRVQQTATMLEFLAPFLYEVRLYFIGRIKPEGRDADYGYTTSKPCLLDRDPTRRTDLWTMDDTITNVPPFNQNIGSNPICSATGRLVKTTGLNIRYVSIIRSIQMMKNLETLVLDEIDLLLLTSAVLVQKPALKNLRITTSPDNLLGPRPCGALPLPSGGPTIKAFARLEKLSLSANAVLDGVQLPMLSLATLQEFSWIVPNQDANIIFHCDWVTQTARLLGTLGAGAHKLHTLRICMERPLSDGSQADTLLSGAFRHHLPSLKRLRVLELHIRTESVWLGREIIHALPVSLTRFYTTERLISVQRLIEFTWAAGLINQRTSFLNHNLGFIGYEFTDPEAWMTILWLNGRLLDHERNLGRPRDGGTQSRLGMPSVLAQVSFERLRILRPQHVEPGSVKSISLHELGPAPANEEDYGYSPGAGADDDDLAKVWGNELTAQPGDLPPLRYVVNVPVEEGEHWMSEA